MGLPYSYYQPLLAHEWLNKPENQGKTLADVPTLTQKSAEFDQPIGDVPVKNRVSVEILIITPECIPTAMKQQVIRPVQRSLVRLQPGQRDRLTAGIGHIHQACRPGKGINRKTVQCPRAG